MNDGEHDFAAIDIGAALASWWLPALIGAAIALLVMFT